MRSLAEGPGREFALPSAVEDAFGQLALFGVVRHGHVLLLTDFFLLDQGRGL